MLASEKPRWYLLVGIERTHPKQFTYDKWILITLQLSSAIACYRLVCPFESNLVWYLDQRVRRSSQDLDLVLREKRFAYVFCISGLRADVIDVSHLSHLLGKGLIRLLYDGS